MQPVWIAANQPEPERLLAIRSDGQNLSNIKGNKYGARVCDSPDSRWFLTGSAFESADPSHLFKGLVPDTNRIQAVYSAHIVHKWVVSVKLTVTGRIQCRTDPDSAHFGAKQNICCFPYLPHYSPWGALLFYYMHFNISSLHCWKTFCLLPLRASCVRRLLMQLK